MDVYSLLTIAAEMLNTSNLVRFVQSVAGNSISSSGAEHAWLVQRLRKLPIWMVARRGRARWMREEARILN